MPVPFAVRLAPVLLGTVRLAPLLLRAVRLAPLLLGASLIACAEERPLPPPDEPDAGVLDCTPGTSGCVCAEGATCRVGSLCISGRCLEPEGGGQPVPNDDRRPPVPRPPPTRPDAGPAPSPSAPSDAGAVPSDASTASDAG